MSDQCIFCQIAKNKIDSATIFENSEFKVIMDAFPASKGHCLIITKEHSENIYDLSADTAGKLFALSTQVARAMKNALKCDGLNVVQNNGKAAGQVVNHFHLHLIPRYENDTVHVHWQPGKESTESLKEMAKEIAKGI
mgnify:CR=1 FL=1